MWLFTYLPIALIGYNNMAQIDQVRQLFVISSIDEESNEKLFELTEGYELKANTLLYAYHAASIMIRANHAYWPTTKLNYFTEGKEKLEKAVNFDLTNVEIRFIRYSVQNGSPAILGYTENLEEDKNYILANMDKTNWAPIYKQEIKEFLTN